MASQVSFTEKAVALYGARQTGGVGVPETLSSSHALAALTLSFEDNITSNEEAYLGNVMQREASVAITDRFADVKVETILPRLGSLFGKALFGRETAVLKFIDVINATTGATFSAVGATDVFTATGFTPVNGDAIAFPTISSTTAGIAANTVYFIRDVAGATFKIAATVGGAAIDITADLTGTASIAVVTMSDNSSTVYMVITSNANATQLAEELNAYLNTDTTPSVHTAFSGVPPVDYTYALSAEDTATILATAVANNTDAADLIISGTQAAKLTLNQNDQQTGALKALAVLPFMEAGKFHAIVDTALSMPQDIDIKYAYCDTKIQEAITENNWALNNIINAERAVTKLNLLDLGTNAENIAVDTLLADLSLAKTKAITIDTELRAASKAIADLRHAVEQAMLTEIAADVRTAMHTHDGLVVAAITGIQADIELITVGSLLEKLADVEIDIAALPATPTNTNILSEFITLRDRANDFYQKAEIQANLLPVLVYTGGVDALTYATDAETLSIAVNSDSTMEAVVKSVAFTNEFPSEDTLTLHVRKSSVNLAGLQKTIIVTDAVATVDLTVEVGQRPKIAFNYHGNIYDIVNIPELSYPISQQKADAAYVTKAENVRNASLQPTGEGLILNNVCFSKLSATNIDGFEHQRVMTGCADTWDVAAKAGAVTITILEPEANTNIVTQFNVEDSLGEEFWFNFKQDGTSGNTVEITLTKLILKGYKQTTVNNRAAFDLDFTFSGFSKIELK